MGSKAPDPPDLGPLAEGSAESARIAQETAREQLQWSKDQDSANRILLDRVLKGQEEIQNDTLENARQDRQRYEQIYQPLEDNLVQEFNSYDSPERRAEERGRVMSDVTSSFDAARRNALQRLESFGVDPSQTRNAALDIGTRTQQAAAMAGAATASDRATEQTGRALRAEALNIGKGYPSNVAGSYGQSLQAGNSMVGNANQTTGTSSQAMQGANSYLNTSIAGYGQAGNTMTQGFNNQMQAFNANQATTNAAIGAVGGIAGMFMADGGEVPFDSQPGLIDYGEGDGSGIDDKVPIHASTDEYIIPADVVRAKGVEFFDKLVERYHTPAEQQRRDDQKSNFFDGGFIQGRPPQGQSGFFGAPPAMSRQAVQGPTPMPKQPPRGFIQGPTPMPKQPVRGFIQGPRPMPQPQMMPRPQPAPQVRSPAYSMAPLSDAEQADIATRQRSMQTSATPAPAAGGFQGIRSRVQGIPTPTAGGFPNVRARLASMQGGYSTAPLSDAEQADIAARQRSAIPAAPRPYMGGAPLRLANGGAIRRKGMRHALPGGMAYG